MADKKAPADGWPVISGDYIVGDPESPVAVTTLASHIEAELSGAAIAGPCKTENLGRRNYQERREVCEKGNFPRDGSLHCTGVPDYDSCILHLGTVRFGEILK